MVVLYSSKARALDIGYRLSSHNQESGQVFLRNLFVIKLYIMVLLISQILSVRVGRTILRK